MRTSRRYRDLPDSLSIVKGRRAEEAAVELKKRYADAVRLFKLDLRADRSRVDRIRRDVQALDVAGRRRVGYLSGPNGLVEERSVVKHSREIADAQTVVKTARTLLSHLNRRPTVSVSDQITDQRLSEIRRQFDALNGIVAKHWKSVQRHHSRDRRAVQQLHGLCGPHAIAWGEIAQKREREITRNWTPGPAKIVAGIRRPPARPQIDPNVQVGAVVWQDFGRRLASLANEYD
ncbi:hypothetical protein AAFP35_25555 [Gordonia sp. CPCC 206044]|uniref:hypothetical protein n=1 Tax=Gordonia sp. CPCC 206044 TaxID=3140793 RepID=UPI003AF3CA42